MKRLFGTDGIRGVAGEYPLDRPTVRKFGLALARVMGGTDGHPPVVVLGRDTRESGTWLRDEVAAGMAVEGGRGVDAGVITTPGLAHAVRIGKFDAGIMISASHNPYLDNGLKVFSREGTKFPDDLEAQIESAMLDSGLDDPGRRDAAVTMDTGLVNRYTEFLVGSMGERSPLRGIRLVMDCANGAAAALAPDLYRRLGAEVETLGISPDGTNINRECGSLFLDRLAERVRESGFDLGLAFDGDADRALAVDRTGREVDGDYILYLGARSLRRAGQLRGSAVVATIMSNFWLEKRLQDEGIELHRAPVGDKYVLERMISEDAALGGEQSGHIIYRDLSTTGDGMLTGLLLLRCLQEENRSLEGIRDSIHPYPQVLLNVKVNEKPVLLEHPTIGPAVRSVMKDLEGTGRVVLRYSGTEPLARVMVEGEDPDAVDRHARALAGLIEGELS